MNSKAASILLLIFEILVVLLVVYIATSIAESYGKSETVAKINAAEDLRMMIDTLVSIPGDAVVKFPRPVSSFSFILRQNSIAVFSTGDQEHLWVVRRFQLPASYTAEGVVENPPTLCLEKKEKKIVVKACP